MEVLFTLTRQMDDGRISNWRFVKTDEVYFSIGGNYKILQYKSEFSMNKSKDWFVSKGYAIAWHLIPPNGGSFLHVQRTWNMEYSALYTAYAEYAERMFDASDDLVVVDVDTVPVSVDWDRLAEWADVGWRVVPLSGYVFFIFH